MIPNSSFGSFTCCPFNPGGIGDLPCLNDWQIIQGSPDFFHYCGGPSLRIPNNSWGYQESIDDSGYVGAYAYNYPFILNTTTGREYFGVALTDTLKQGYSYKFEYYISLANNSQYAVKNIGVFFSAFKPIGNGNPGSNLNVIPQSIINYHLTDTSNWIQITDTIMADGGEYFMTVGNFFSDSVSDTLRVRPIGGLYSYVYYDSFSLTELPLSIGEHRRFDMELLPNPSQGLFTLRKLPVALKRVKLSMLSAEGRIIEEELLDVHNRSVTFQSKSPPGFYMLRLADADGEQGFGLKKIIIQ